MSEYRHPLRDMPLRVYRRLDGEEFIANFHPISVSPIRFSGTTEEEVRRKAEQFRQEKCEKHELAYQKRMEALEKGRQKRKGKS